MVDAALVKLVATVRKGLVKSLASLTPGEVDELCLCEHNKLAQAKANRSSRGAADAAAPNLAARLPGPAGRIVATFAHLNAVYDLLIASPHLLAGKAFEHLVNRGERHGMCLIVILSRGVALKHDIRRIANAMLWYEFQQMQEYGHRVE